LVLYTVVVLYKMSKTCPVVFNSRRYANMVYANAMALCLSVYPPVFSVSQSQCVLSKTPRFVITNPTPNNSLETSFLLLKTLMKLQCGHRIAGCAMPPVTDDH